jgi:hypothetical protein
VSRIRSRGCQIRYKYAVSADSCEGTPLFVHSRCEDGLLARAELLLFAEDAAQAYPGRPVVCSYDVEPGISISDLKQAYRYDRKGYERLQQRRR